MEHLRENDKLKFFSPKPPDPRVVERWKARLESLSNSEGYVLHTTLALTNTKIFYVSEVRESVKSILAGLLPRFVIKLEGAWQKSGFLFPHAHLLLSPVSEVRPFLTALKWSGVEVVQLEYKGRLLPDPFTILPDHGPTNAGEYIFSLPDISALETLVDFRESTINVLKNSPFLARYFSKVTYSGGLKPVMEHNLK